jgi:hypothetical protein
MEIDNQQFECFKDSLDGAVSEVHQLRQRTRELEAELKMRRQMESGEVWYWQSEGGNHIESASCPVVIPAHALRALLDARPIKPESDDIDFGTISRAYDFTVDWDGNVLGLVNGDHGYDYTGLKLSAETMAMFLCRRDTNEDLAASARFYRRGSDQKIDEVLDQLGFVAVHSTTWWSVVDFLHSHGRHLDAGAAHARALPITPLVPATPPEDKK